MTSKPPKRPSNLSVTEALPSKPSEQVLTTALRNKQRALWLAENKAAIEPYNAHVAQHGVFSDGLRSF